MAFTLRELAKQTNTDYHGDAQVSITGLATLQNAQSGDISFLANPLYKKYLASTKASAVILSSEYQDQCAVAMLVSSNPYATYAKIAHCFHPVAQPQGGIHPSAVVASSASIDESAWIGPQAVVEPGAKIGAHCVIGPASIIGANVTIGANTRLVARVTLCEAVQIGERVILHPGVVIGSDGFGIAMDAGRWLKVPQVGIVRVGDDVEIGANTTVDRGALEDTIIEQGVKIDNQVQIAHNVTIGEHTAIAGCVGVSGSAHIGRYCAIGGGVGIAGHLTIADNVQITGMSLVSRSIARAGVYSSSTPVMPVDQWHRNFARFRRLDRLHQSVRMLEKAILNKKGEESN